MHARTRGPLQDVSVCVRVRVRVVCCRPTVSLISSDRATMTSHGPVQKEDVKEDREERWTDFIYNSRTGEFCGRTGRSWGLILLFYSVFYGFLTGMFSLTMFVMLQTLDPDVPRHQNLVKSPGLVIRPHVVEISYNRSEPSDYLKYVEQLHELLQKYNDSVQEKNDLCLVGEYTEQEEVKEQREKKVCQFKRSVLSQCSGLMDPFYGYGDGTPCVIVKMNRIIGLKPKGDPFINCTAKTSLRMQYYPAEGRIDRMFFPYYGKNTHSDYVQPLVAVKLLINKSNNNDYQTIVCTVEGSDLRNHDERDKSLGRVTFRVRVTQ
ncbi:sodium/potassium-transporting ATPase subunit beta-3b isoform X2 [Gouania willdenowi]|uniref:Sodium/potassium-transporting ATPase subunit beta n=1 Tax=Gouania willdenowi TaxID=441366 RepID=A0A8C5D6Y7_GOUWI|nr:sodium/potassium-transporting ATPase subunit beta-3-like isoform X2 [Gouania willdenowi]